MLWFENSAYNINSIYRIMKTKTAKQRHKDTLLRYLSDWDNPWPTRDKMAEICGVKRSTLRGHFLPDDYAEVEALGLELRLKNSAAPRASAYQALADEASTGNVPAIKELLDRTEGKVTDKIENKITADDNLIGLIVQVANARHKRLSED